MIHDRRTEQRRKGAMDVLGALGLAACVFVPVFLWYTGAYTGVMA